MYATAPVYSRLNDAESSSRKRIATSTVVILIGALISFVFAYLSTSVIETFRSAAIIFGFSLALAMIIEAYSGLRQMIRVDIFMILVLYLLTFLEFLFPQPEIEWRLRLEAAKLATYAVLLGFSGIVIGRHAFKARSMTSLGKLRVSPNVTMLMIFASFFFGYLYIFLAVNFDIVEALYQMSRPRFSQPWVRGRIGSLSTLLNELGLLKYLLPPLIASVFAQAKHFSFLQKLLVLPILAFVFYEAFAEGTRNVFLAHVATFSVTYAITHPRFNLMRAIAFFVPVGALVVVSILYMTAFRTVGLQNFDFAAQEQATVFVDLNIVNLSELTEVFPERYDYLGTEIPIVAAVRPVPRALWPGKPEGLSVSIEEALGAQGLTLSTTFVGEFWMAGGFIAIGFGSFLLGIVASFWNRVGANATSNLGFVLYASGFFSAGICMRSFLSVAPTILPIIALFVFLKIAKSRV